jgi:glycosyltransferase involved in cell wall biosynthesis
LQNIVPLLQRRRELYLLLIGDGPERKAIARLAGENGLGDRIKLLGFRQDVSCLLKLADIYCHPALMESLPLAVVEAMAHRLPIIAAPVGGIPEFLTHLENGILQACDEVSGPDLSAWIERLMDDERLRDRIAHAACLSYEQGFTASVMAEAYRHYYASLGNVSV